MNTVESKKVIRRVKRTFLKKGTCSRTFCYILNQEFGFPLEEEERAADPLAGGIMQQGYQCGMLWGASLAVGAEAYRRSENIDQAIALSISATQHVVKSFMGRTKTVDCGDITETNFASKLSMAKYMFSGRFFSCFQLAEKWAPEAIDAAIEGLSVDKSALPQHAISCASEVASKMGASDEEMVMVAGFAGGLGLSENGCGALAAAIWMNTLSRIRKENLKISYTDPIAEKIVAAFYAETDYKMLCNNISGEQFETIDHHTNFLKNGGCQKLISTLADAASVK